jgi:hypothetical protein
MLKNKIIRYNILKNKTLKETRGVGFEDVILSIENGGLLDDIRH